MSGRQRVFTPSGRARPRFAAGTEWVRPVVESYGATVGLHSRRQFENSRPPFLSCVCQIQEAKVKRVILGAAATAVAATAAVLVPNVAGATGSTGGTSDSVYIYPYADYNLSGASLERRPIHLLALGPRDTMLDAVVVERGTETIRWGGKPVVAHKMDIVADSRTTFTAWTGTKGQLLRLTEPVSGLRVQREPPAVRRKAAPSPVPPPKPGG